MPPTILKSFYLSNICNKLLSNFNTSISKSFKYLNEEYPVPKSSKNTLTPKLFNNFILLLITLNSFINTFSVISIDIWWGSISSLYISLVNLLINPFSKNCFGVTLNETFMFLSFVFNKLNYFFNR